MADIIKRTWRSGPRKVKRVAYGYTLQVDGKQVRRFSSECTEDDAEKALAAAVLERGVPTCRLTAGGMPAWDAAQPGGRGRRARRPVMCAVASAPGAAGVRVWEVASR